MNKQSITPEQFRAVAGTMPACRAADALGISQANFYRLAQSYSISTAFVYKPCRIKCGNLSLKIGRKWRLLSHNNGTYWEVMSHEKYNQLKDRKS